MNKKKLVKSILNIGLIGSVIGGAIYSGQKFLKKETVSGKRYKTYYELVSQWLMNKNEDKNISNYFIKKGIKKISIYGMGTLAELFYEEMKKTDIEISYFIDRNTQELCYGLDNISIVDLDDIVNQEKVDAIIVTPIFDYDDIVLDLKGKGINETIISLESIIYEM